MNDADMVMQVLGNENSKRIRASRVALIEEARQAGIEEAGEYLKQADYRDMLLITQIQPDDDGRYYLQLEEITCWDMSGTLENFPERMHRYIEHGFVNHVISIVVLIEAHDAMQYSSDLVARLKNDFTVDGVSDES